MVKWYICLKGRSCRGFVSCQLKPSIESMEEKTSFGSPKESLSTFTGLVDFETCNFVNVGVFQSQTTKPLRLTAFGNP